MKKLIFTFSCLVYTITLMAQGSQTGMLNGYGYVDLGLPSGTMWATCNVGAQSQEEFGNYYAWGEVETKEKYKNDNYAWGIVTSTNSVMHKYSVNDNKYNLELKDDAAHLKWGGNWRIPTLGEFKELVDNCSSEWTSLNGVKGLKMTSKINGNSIFLPATGYKRDLTPEYMGTSGRYWTSSRGSNQAFAGHLFISDEGSHYHIGDCSRTIGHTIRAVTHNGIASTIEKR